MAELKSLVLFLFHSKNIFYSKIINLNIDTKSF